MPVQRQNCMRITEHRVLYGTLGEVGVNSDLTGGSFMEWGAGFRGKGNKSTFQFRRLHSERRSFIVRFLVPPRNRILTMLASKQRFDLKRKEASARTLTAVGSTVPYLARLRSLAKTKQNFPLLTKPNSRTQHDCPACTSESTGRGGFHFIPRFLKTVNLGGVILS